MAARLSNLMEWIVDQLASYRMRADYFVRGTAFIRAQQGDYSSDIADWNVNAWASLLELLDARLVEATDRRKHCNRNRLWLEVCRKGSNVHNSLRNVDVQLSDEGIDYWKAKQKVNFWIDAYSMECRETRKYTHIVGCVCGSEALRHAQMEFVRMADVLDHEYGLRRIREDKVDNFPLSYWFQLQVGYVYRVAFRLRAMANIQMNSELCEQWTHNNFMLSFQSRFGSQPWGKLRS